MTIRSEFSKWGFGNPYKNYMTNQKGSTKWKEQGYIKNVKNSSPGNKVNKNKVVLVHGLFSSPKKFSKMKAQLKQQGFQVVTVTHKMPMKPTDHLKVRKFLDMHSYAGLFIGHSY